MPQVNTPGATPAKPWYSIRAGARGDGASAPAGAAEIWIYGDIGESWDGESVTAAALVRELAALDASALTLRINSFGGSVADGLAIYNALKRHPAAITVVIDGIAFSIASLIAMAGDTVEMAENAMLMIHAPWLSYVSGNAQQLRTQADQLDTWAQAMAQSYAARMGDAGAALALLTDGQDHYYTAEQARALGLVDRVGAATAVAAAARAALPAQRFSSLPAAPAASTPKESIPMPTPTPQAAAPIAAPAGAPALDAGAILAQDAQRRSAIRASFAVHAHAAGVPELQRQCEDDHAMSAQAAGLKLLAHLGSTQASATGGAATRIVVESDERDKFRASAQNAILAKAGAEKADGANPLRGASLVDIARASLRRAGHSGEGAPMQVVASAFTQSGSDFPLLLENAMHKTLQAAYASAALTWQRFCSVGTLSDFRVHSRYRMGSLGNLDALNELGEFKTRAIPDAERASIQATTVGNLLSISRQAVINDDLGALTGLAAMQGRAAARTIEAYVYALLAQNAGMGPTMGDGKPLFHADHGNVGAAGALGVAALDDARVKLASQRDVGGNDFLDLRPSILLCPMGLGGAARVINSAEYDPDGKMQRPNAVRGLFADVVDSPRLSGTRFYTFAAPADAPVIEVAFIDGVQTPYLEAKDGWSVDGSQYKVRLDFGVAAIDYRGAVTSAGQ